VQQKITSQDMGVRPLSQNNTGAWLILRMKVLLDWQETELGYRIDKTDKKASSRTTRHV